MLDLGQQLSRANGFRQKESGAGDHGFLAHCIMFIGTGSAENYHRDFLRRIVCLHCAQRSQSIRAIQKQIHDDQSRLL